MLNSDTGSQPVNHADYLNCHMARRHLRAMRYYSDRARKRLLLICSPKIRKTILLRSLITWVLGTREATQH